MSHPVWLRAAEELRDDMVVVVSLALDILPAAYEAQRRYLVAAVVASFACSAAAVVPAVGPPLRSRTVWVEAEEVAPVAEDAIGAARLAWCHKCPGHILLLPADATDSMDSMCALA